VDDSSFPPDVEKVLHRFSLDVLVSDLSLTLAQSLPEILKQAGPMLRYERDVQNIIMKLFLEKFANFGFKMEEKIGKDKYIGEVCYVDFLSERTGIAIELKYLRKTDSSYSSSDYAKGSADQLQRYISRPQVKCLIFIVVSDGDYITRDQVKQIAEDVNARCKEEGIDKICYPLLIRIPI